MKKNLTLYLSLILIIILATLHLLALQHSLYWVYSWFDILTHFLGGAWVTVTVIWIFKKFNIFTDKIFLASFVSVLIISFFWEIFELLIWESLNEPNYLFDTILDTGSALAGSLIILIFSKILSRNNTNEHEEV